MISRVGKIARLPASIREEINCRLAEGESGRKILPWLNKLPEVIAALEEDFEGLSVNDQNLSDWRLGGYQDWLKRRDRIEQTREMAKFSMQIAKAGGGSLSEGAAAILSGRVLEVLEQLDGLVKTVEGDTAEQTREKMGLIGGAIEGLTLAVARLRKGDHNAEALRLTRERLKQGDQQLRLEREKFERLVCEKLLDAAKLAQAREIAASDRSNAEKIAALRQAYFADVDALEQSGEVKLPPTS